MEFDSKFLSGILIVVLFCTTTSDLNPLLKIPLFFFQFSVRDGNHSKIYMETEESATAAKLNKQSFKADSKTFPFPVGGFETAKPQHSKT